MEFLFGHRKTPTERLRECKRTIDRTVRDLEREKTKLENEKKNLTINIKKAAKQGQMESVRIFAKQMSISMKVQTLKSTADIGSSMKQLAISLRKMNTSMRLPELQKIMAEFEKQSEIMDMKEEMISDTIDDVLGEDDDIEESDNIVNKVLEELGIELNSQLSGLPTTNNTIGNNASTNKNRHALPSDGASVPYLPSISSTPGETVDENDLETRLARLKKG